MTLITAAILALFPQTSATEAADTCFLPNVKSISVPLHADDPNSPHVPYRFQVLGNPEGKKIIFMPGGPGSEVIDEWEDNSYDQEFASARNAQLIVLETRGSGCNEEAFESFGDLVYSTKDIANDAKEVIKALKLTEYWIYGASYGTQSATVLANLTEQSKDVAVPRGVVLSGTVGSGFDNDETQMKAEIQQWKELDKTAYQKALHLLHTSPRPHGLPLENWLKYLLDGFDMGTTYSRGKPVHRTIETLKILEHQNARELADLKKDVAENSPERGDDFASSRLYRDIECNEWLAADDPGYLMRTKIEGDHMVPYRLTKTKCQVPRKIQHFDPKLFPIKAPLYYFQGKRDTITAFHAFEQHFLAQNSRRNFALIAKEGGHGALYTSYLRCKDELWKSIFADGAGFREAALHCEAPSLVRINGIESDLTKTKKR